MDNRLIVVLTSFPGFARSRRRLMSGFGAARTPWLKVTEAARERPGKAYDGDAQEA